MGSLFGTDGIRGIANRYPVNPEMGIYLGRAMVSYVGKNPFLITGRDTRISGIMLEYALISGIISLGGDVFSAGVIPTPGLSYLIRRFNASGGVMVSASHNPYEYNGFKPFIKDGEKLSEEEEERIEDIIKRMADISSDSIGKIKEPKEDPLKCYKEFLLSTVPDGISFEDISIVVDCANGATYKIAPSLLRELGMNVYEIGTNPDGRNINDGCGAVYPDLLRDEVLKRKADLGVSFDGDGDRLIAVDRKGNILNGDRLIAIFAKMLKKEGKLRNPVVVTTVMSNIGLRIALKDMGIEHVMTKVGDRNVVNEMKRRGAILGGEESGHIVFLNHHVTGDGILSALKLLSAIKILNSDLSELFLIMREFPQVKVNVKVKEKPDLNEIPEIVKVIKEVEDSLSGKGRVLVRYSGTEPLCRIMVEGENMEKIKEYAEMIASAIKDSIG